MLRLALSEPIQLLEVGREGVVWTATSGQNQNQGTSQKKAKTVVVFFFFWTKLNYFRLRYESDRLVPGK